MQLFGITNVLMFILVNVMVSGSMPEQKQ